MCLVLHLMAEVVREDNALEIQAKKGTALYSGSTRVGTRYNTLVTSFVIDEATKDKRQAAPLLVCVSRLAVEDEGRQR
jgi:hypothetical protein